MRNYILSAVTSVLIITVLFSCSKDGGDNNDNNYDKKHAIESGPIIINGKSYKVTSIDRDYSYYIINSDSYVSSVRFHVVVVFKDNKNRDVAQTFFFFYDTDEPFELKKGLELSIDAGHTHFSTFDDFLSSSNMLNDISNKCLAGNIIIKDYQKKKPWSVTIQFNNLTIQTHDYYGEVVTFKYEGTITIPFNFDSIVAQ